MDNAVHPEENSDEELLRLLQESIDGLEGPELAAHEEPASSSSSSSGSSSGSSSSSSSSSSSDAEPAMPKSSAKSRAKAKAARSMNPRATFRYGMGTAVRTYKSHVEDGWEMICSHPAHTEFKCRKHLKDTTRTRSKEDTLHCLKIWLIRGRHCTSAQEHKEVWSEVERDFKLEGLPEEPPLNYTGKDGLVHHYEPRVDRAN